VIIGGGRLGEAFAKMGLGNDVIVRRGEAFPTEAPKGPIYVCTRNDALEGVIAAVPEDRYLEIWIKFCWQSCWLKYSKGSRRGQQCQHTRHMFVQIDIDF